MNTTPKQRQYIHQLCGCDTDKKRSLVFSITNDARLTSTHDLDFDQANALIITLGGKPTKIDDSWGRFTKGNTQHSYILSLCMQAGKNVYNSKYGWVADLQWLHNFLKSDKSPVKKALNKMSENECSKLITALEGIVKSTHAKRRVQA